MTESYVAPRGGVDLIGGHGGGVGALNTYYKALVEELTSQGRRVLLAKNGYYGLLQPNEGIIDLSAENLPTDFFDMPGSSLGSPKGSPVAKKPGPGDRLDDVVAALKEWQVERVFFTCGNGGVKNNNRVMEASGVEHILVGKTSDGNFPDSYALGFSSAVSHDIAAVKNLEAAAMSSKLIYCVQQMDDGSGQPGLWAARYTNTQAALVAPDEYTYDKDDLTEHVIAPFHRSRGKLERPPYSIVLIGENIPTFEGQVLKEKRLDGTEYPANMSQIFADAFQINTGIQARAINLKHLSRGSENSVDAEIARRQAHLAAHTRHGVVCIQHAHLYLNNQTGNLHVDGGEYRIIPVSKVANSPDLGVELRKSYEAVRAKGIYAGTPIKEAARAAVA